MVKWTEIMEQNREEIVKALEKSFKEAVDCRYMQFITEIYQDGTIRTWSCAAGSSSYSYDSWNGDSIVVGSFCFQNMDIEVTAEDFRRHMTEKEQKDVEWRAEEEALSFLSCIYGSGNYRELIEEVEQEWLDWYKEEYAYITACEVIDNKTIDEYRAEGC